MTDRIKQSRIRILRAALREAMIVSDREAVKRLTRKIVELIQQ